MPLVFPEMNSLEVSMHSLDESLLSPLPPFSMLDRPQIRTILDQAISRRANAGETIFEEGSAANRFFLLLDGTIRVVKITPDGEQVTSLHIPAGQLFGIAQALGRDTYPASAVTASEALFLSWPNSLWHSFAATYPGFASETYKAVGKRVDEMNTRIVEMSTQHVEQRIARALLRLINQSGRRTVEGIEISFPITRQDVSQMTGTTLHTVSRLLSAWEKDGLVLSKRKKIIVCDAHRLVLLSGE
jgi:CRP-like cAMP-binding protein